MEHGLLAQLRELRNELFILEYLCVLDIGLLLPVDISSEHVQHGNGEHIALVKHLRLGSAQK